MSTGIIIILITIYLLFIIKYLHRVIMNYDNCNPVKTVGWILAIFLLPGIGILLYVLIGRNLKKKRSYYKKLYEKIREQGKSRFGFTYTENDDLLKKYNKLKTLLMSLYHLPVFPGNKIDLFPDAREKFDHLFKDMENARSHIHVLYYTIVSDEIGTQFKNIIIKKAREGVKIRLIYDDIGSNECDSKYFKEIRKAGIEVRVFSPMRFPRLIRSINYRNHKKIVVIDGEIAYTGGINVKDEYLKGVKWGIWKDFHLRIQGAGAQGLQSVFLTDWFYVSNEFINSKEYFPEIRTLGNNPLQVISAEPIGRYSNICQGMVNAIMSAKKSVYIETPYFVPTESLLTALQSTGLSGIEVHIIIPEISDNKKVEYAGNSYVMELLTANIQVYQYNKGFIHSKLMVIDDELLIAGSSNMDIRSLELNFETSVFIYNQETAIKAKNIILEDIEDSTAIDKEEWENRPNSIKFKESFYRLFSPLL